MHRMRDTLVELCMLYAQDDTEQADLRASGILKRQFSADAVALFYQGDSMGYRYCLAGADFPITLPEERWKDSVRESERNPETIHFFGPWSVPGFEKSLRHWMSVRLYASGNALGYLLLGKDEEAWTAVEAEGLAALVQAINPIVEVRMQRNKAEAERRSAEKSLAEKERRLRALFEGSPDMIYTADSRDVLTGINRAGASLLGYDDSSQLLGRPMGDLALNADDRQVLLNRIRTNGYAADYEIIFKGRDGTPIFCTESTTAIKDSAGRIVEIQGIVKDLSERIRSERELWQTNFELSELTVKLRKTQAVMVQHEKLASIGQLAAGVAHEINNPLGFLKSNHTMAVRYLEKLLATLEGINPAQEKLVRSIEQLRQESEEGFSRIIRIVQDLKSFSRVDQGDARELYDLNSGIESTLVVAWNEIKYVAEVEKDLAELPKISARGGEINQVLLNILVNAAQAIGSQGRPSKGTIRIRTGSEKGWVRLEIGDDGPGIPEKIRSRIFDPFFTTKAPGEGTGLGLSISYNIIVNNHGGRIRVESQEGRGTTFIIELPAAAD